MTRAPVYRFSGRGDGLSHVGLKINWDTFSFTHFPFGIVLFCTGVVMLALQQWYLFLIVSFAPACLWLWTALLFDNGTFALDMSLRG